MPHLLAAADPSAAFCWSHGMAFILGQLAGATLIAYYRGLRSAGLPHRRRSDELLAVLADQTPMPPARWARPWEVRR